jgi:hypothetical protein
MKKLTGVQAASGGAELQAAMDAFARWRAEKKSGEKIPQALWQTAVSLHPRHTVYQISRTLHLDFVDLRDRVSASGRNRGSKSQESPQFVQLPMTVGGGRADCRVKVSGTGKVRIAIKLEGAGPQAVIELLRELWQR